MSENLPAEVTPPPSRAAQIAFDVGLAITNLTKLAGAVMAFNEGLIRSNFRPTVMVVAALMVAGAQGLDTFLDKLFDKLFGR